MVYTFLAVEISFDGHESISATDPTKLNVMKYIAVKIHIVLFISFKDEIRGFEAARQ